MPACISTGGLLGSEAFLERYIDLQERAFESKDFEEAMTAYRAKHNPEWH